jgi:Arc/MetJ-type ribon-helix-helix transcriptional regulator
MKPTTIRLTEEDRRLIAELKKRYGIHNTAELIRLALRMLAERKEE